MRRALVVFAKPPTAGVAKTRLVEALGVDGAASVASAMLDDTFTLCEGVRLPSGEVPGLVVAYAESKEYFEDAVECRMAYDRWRLLAQGKGNLGERLDKALADMAPQEDDLTVFIGMDAPHLPARLIVEAFERLVEARAVLGPCDDGGYYLVGVKGRWPTGILAPVGWSTPEAMADTAAAFERAGMDCAVLEPWYDVDDLADLGRLGEDLKEMDAGAMPMTRVALHDLGLG
jgi:rSAM/selenodomain-associated transferase 1